VDKIGKKGHEVSAVDLENHITVADKRGAFGTPSISRNRPENDLKTLDGKGTKTFKEGTNPCCHTHRKVSTRRQNEIKGR